MENTESTSMEMLRVVAEKQKPKIDFYLSLYRAIRREAMSDELALSIMAQIGTDLRGERIESRRAFEAAQKPRGNEATLKQIGKLRALGVEVRNGISKTEASILIDRALGK